MLLGCGSSDPNSSSSNEPSIANTSPTLGGTPAQTVWVGDAYRFRPQATGGDGDTLTFAIEHAPPWANFDAATGALSGVPGTADVGRYLDVRISASDGRDRGWLPSFDLTVRDVSHGAMLLQWEAPNANIDDSPLDDLKGFRIYWGTDPKWPANLVTVAGAASTAYYFSNLTPGTYYFATTAVNDMGIESERSDLATMVVR